LTRRRLVAFVCSALLAVLALAIPASASAERVLYAGPEHAIDSARLVTFGAHTLVDTFDGTSDSEWGSALARTDYDVLVVGEDASQSPPGATTLDSIASYVSGGRLIIITGAHGSENDFMNDIFGFSTTNEASDGSESLTASLQPGAAGTPFAGGPATLTSPSDTQILGSTPGTTIYAGAEGTWVFFTGFGSGKVAYLAWDLCGEAEGGCGNTPSVEDDWYRVLDRAIQLNRKPPTPTTPAATATATCKGKQATIVGTAQANVLTGTSGRDVIAALGGNDKVSGLAGKDLICGNAGKDKLLGGKGKDRLFGQKGKDKLRGGGGQDVCKGGAGNDTASKCEVEKSI
jgi:Ca2+-binding RTX toxin-like protein